MQVDIGDRVLGAFGVRFATLEATGTWEAIGPDGRMTALTAAGLFGGLTSQSPLISTLTRLGYSGHVMIVGRKATMSNPDPATWAALDGLLRERFAIGGR